MSQSKLPEMVCPKRHYVNGIPLVYNMTEATVRYFKTMEMYDGDVIVTGYMKNGNHWIETIVAALMADDLDDFCKTGLSRTRLPVEIDFSMEQFKAAKRPTFMMTHLRYQHLPEQLQTKKVKIIHISRNPKDTAVSYYNFCRMCEPLGYYQGTFGSFMDAFLTGDVPYGSYFEYLKDWMKYKEDPKILFLKYEEIRGNPLKHIKRIADFLEIPLPEEKADKVVEITSFNSMKKNPALNVTDAIYDQTISPFMRKGKSGGWKEVFTVAQNEQFDEVCKKFEKETGIRLIFDSQN